MAERSPAPLPLMTDPIQAIDRHPVPAVLITLAVLTALVPLGLFVRRTLRATQAPAENMLTVIAAGIATCVAAQGMWQFFGDVLGFSGPLRVLTFAFIEVSVITSAVRARASMRENHSAGVDGVAVWVLTCLSATLSSLDAKSFGETILRLTAPLVAAWLWERGMALERRRITGRSGINWRFTPERILVRLGLADPTDRTADEVDAQRRLMRLALAAKHARTVRAARGARAQRKAMGKLDRAMERAVEYGGLDTDRSRQDMLLAQLGLLYNATTLLDVTPEAPWTRVPDDDPASEPDRSGKREDHRAAERRQEPDRPPYTGRSEPGPDAPAKVSADGQADMSSTAGRPANDTSNGGLAAPFLDALTKHQGSVPAARAELEQAGRTPPSPSYAYQLRKRWQAEQTSASGRLARVV